MTARMKNPSRMAQRKHDLAPKADFATAHDRSNGAGRGVDTVRSKGIDTSSAARAAEVDVDKPLTEKQKAFAKSWGEGNSLTRAAKDAGFANDGVAYRLARQPNVLALKRVYEAKYESESQMTRKKVMDGFLEAIEMAKLMAEPMTMISGWTAVAKMCGYMAPIEHKVKVDVNGSITMQTLSAMSDAELVEMIENGKPEVICLPH